MAWRLRFGAAGPRTNARSLSVDCTEDALVRPLKVTLAAHSHDERLVYVDAFVEQGQPGLRVARLNALLAEPGAERNDVERPIITSTGRDGEIGRHEARVRGEA